MWLSGMPRMMRGMLPPVRTRSLPVDPDARAWRDRGHLSESRAAGQQRQEDDRKDSTEFHWNALPSIAFDHEDACGRDGEASGLVAWHLAHYFRHEFTFNITNAISKISNTAPCRPMRRRPFRFNVVVTLRPISLRTVETFSAR